MKKMGPLENILKMLPGVNSQMLDQVNIDPKLLARKEAIVQSMTPEERRNPAVINGPRRRRIAKGCGQSVQDVNQFLNEFEQMRKMIRSMMGPGGAGNKPGAGGNGMGSLIRRSGPKMPTGGKGGRFRFPFKH